MTGENSLDEIERAHEALQERRLEHACALLRAIVERTPDHADALHLLGCTHEELGEQELARRCFLRTWELDEAAARSWPEAERQALLDEVLRLAQASLASLPEEFRRRLQHVPLLVEHLPGRELVATGLDPRVLALIEGQDYGGQLSLDPETLPTRVVLFAQNLAAEFPDQEDFEHEVHVTVLHEVGHYFGLDEDDMVRLGLD